MLGDRPTSFPAFHCVRFEASRYQQETAPDNEMVIFLVARVDDCSNAHTHMYSRFLDNAYLPLQNVCLQRGSNRTHSASRSDCGQTALVEWHTV